MYGLDDQGLIPHRRSDFSSCTMSMLALEPTQPSVQWMSLAQVAGL